MQSKITNKLSEGNFRDLYRRIIGIIPSSDTAEVLAGYAGEGDAYLAYGYIDSQAGFSFRILTPIRKEDSGFAVKEMPDIVCILRKEQINECDYLTIEDLNIDIEAFQATISQIDENYKAPNPLIEVMRSFTFLDPLRHPDYPDDFQVILVQEGSEPEGVWVRSYMLTEDELVGSLLNEPYNDFGVHLNDRILIEATKREDGTIVCISQGTIFKDPVGE